MANSDPLLAPACEAFHVCAGGIRVAFLVAAMMATARLLVSFVGDHDHVYEPVQEVVVVLVVVVAASLSFHDSLLLDRMQLEGLALELLL